VLRGVRGGSFNNNDNNLQSDNRNNNDPTNENNNIGFRVASSPSLPVRPMLLDRFGPNCGGEAPTVAAAPRLRDYPCVPRPRNSLHGGAANKRLHLW